MSDYDDYDDDAEFDDLPWYERAYWRARAWWDGDGADEDYTAHEDGDED